MRSLKIRKSITNKEDRSLDSYLQEISKTSLLTIEEEGALAKRIREGDHAALETLVKANLRFVVSVAKQYQHHGLPLSDLINEGNLGLMNAASKFDETKGFKFISYAVWWIRQSILQAITEQSRIIRLPQNKIDSLSKVQKLFSKLSQEYGREPAVEELAEAVNLPVEDLISTMAASSYHTSIDEPVGGEDGDTVLGDLIEDKDAHRFNDDKEYKQYLKVETQNSLRKLGRREKDILVMFFGLGRDYSMQLEEISESIGLSAERIRQIKDRAVRKLRYAYRRRMMTEELCFN